MKKWFSFLIIAIFVASCNLNSEADKSPQVSFFDVTINGEEIDRQYLLVEDTLRMNVVLSGYYHELTELEIIPEDDFVEFSFADSFQQNDFIASESSSAGRYKYVFKPTIKTCVIPIQVVAIQKKQQSVELKFSLESKSGTRGEYNPRAVSFVFEITDPQ
ncbi:MAG: hypothetical protein KA397_00690 [Paludibacteraceae bacterium]|nr:hypothetical protein [Paludibacteraceae bacterium]MBP6283869.1 hypothetical protein [Paludibacteraceae bacterium]